MCEHCNKSKNPAIGWLLEAATTVGIRNKSFLIVFRAVKDAARDSGTRQNPTMHDHSIHTVKGATK